MEQKPENLFLTKHWIAVVSLFYISTAAPFAEKMIEDGVSRKEILHFLNISLVATLAGLAKTYDSNVYTPKGIPGRDKEKALNNILKKDTDIHITTGKE